MEKKLYEWYQNQLQTNELPSRSLIKKTAKKYSTSSNFRASKGWLDKFYQRYNINSESVSK